MSTTATRTVAEFEFQDMGVDHAQYFQGVSVAYTDWDEVYLGAGDTARQAADDALESCLTSDVVWGEAGDVLRPLTDLDDEASAHDDCEGYADNATDEEDEAHSECELYHYVALFVRFETVCHATTGSRTCTVAAGRPHIHTPHGPKYVR